MIFKVVKKSLQRGQKRKKKQKQRQKRIRRFIRRLIGSATLLGLAALGVYLGYTQRKQIKAMILDKILPEGKLKGKLTAKV